MHAFYRYVCRYSWSSGLHAMVFVLTGQQVAVAQKNYPDKCFRNMIQKSKKFASQIESFSQYQY